MKMQLGIDFDNTIICYDGVFHCIALENGLIPGDFPENKEKIRNFLRDQGKEEVWTRMQGVVYGTRVFEAEPFPGVMEFFDFLKTNALPVAIVSHKTRFPYSGEPYDLHKPAHEWMDNSGILASPGKGGEDIQVFFEPSRKMKMERIKDLGCTHFIDDLPEFLLDEAFPDHVTRLLFDPWDRHSHIKGCVRFGAWQDVYPFILESL